MELLAPAGTRESLIAAVENGADAVYLGGKSFNARRFAANFTDQELIEAVNYCHVRGVKVYITVNTLIHEHEIAAALEYILFLFNSGVDAVIVQDLGLAYLVATIFPELQLHASTQMFIHNRPGAEYAQQLGISRVILARELSLKEITTIAQADIEVEVFVHGAVCIGYSGQCLFSSLLGGRSGNRGQCAQPCRLPYQLVDYNSGRAVGQQSGDYLLSPKDLRLIEYLSQLEEAGVTSLKIEGRMKGPEYVALVTKAYRQALEQQIVDDIALASVFNRQFTTLHLLHKQGKQLIRWQQQRQTGDADLVQAASQSYRSPKAMKRIPAVLYARLALGEPLQLTLIDDNGITATAVSELAGEKAQNRPLTQDLLTQQLLRFGNDPLAIENIEIDLGDGVMLPVSQINKTRQVLVKNWEQARIDKYARPVVSIECFRERMHKAVDDLTTELHAVFEPLLAVTVTGFEAAQAALAAGAKLIYYFGNIYSHQRDYMAALEHVTAIAHGYGAQTFVAFERVTHDWELEEIRQILYEQQYDGILVGNVGLWQMLRVSEQFAAYPVHGDWSLNVTNSVTARLLCHQGMQVVYLSPELNTSQIEAIGRESRVPLGMIVHGHLPLLVSEYCPIGACLDCRKDGGTQVFPCHNRSYGIRDRKGYIMPVKLDYRCRMHLFNPVELCLIDYLEKIRSMGVQIVRIEAKDRDPKWVEQIVSAYHRKLKGVAVSQEELVPLTKVGVYTKGHFHRGVK